MSNDLNRTPDERAEADAIEHAIWLELKTRLVTFEAALRAIVDRCDEGPEFCTGVESRGRVVWKGSFHELIERARAAIAEMEAPHGNAH